MSDIPADAKVYASVESDNLMMRQRLAELAMPPPSTKGMGPKDRADRLHAELLRRIKIAREAVRL